MSEFLETTIDKFTFRVATNRLYSADGTWVLWNQQSGTRVRVGLTDFLQRRSGDMAFVSVMPLDTKVKIGDAIAEAETIKVTFPILSPVSGTVVAINKKLETEPELVNQSPFEHGWLAEIEATDWEATRAKLLDPQVYFEIMKTQANAELIK